MAPHSSTLAWRMPWMEEPGKLQSMGSLGVGTRLSDFTFTFHFLALEKEMATHSSVLAWRIPGTGACWAAVCRVTQSRTRLKRLSSSSINSKRSLSSQPYVKRGASCFELSFSLRVSWQVWKGTTPRGSTPKSSQTLSKIQRDWSGDLKWEQSAKRQFFLAVASEARRRGGAEQSDAIWAGSLMWRQQGDAEVYGWTSVIQISEG